MSSYRYISRRELSNLLMLPLPEDVAAEQARQAQVARRA